MELLKGRYNALTAAYDAEVRMYDKSQTKIQTMQSRLNELEANQTRFDTKLRDLQTSIKNKDYQIRSDAVRIAMLEVDKRHITEKLEKAEKGWLAFKGLEDVFERKA
jgi:chromosome segregation ATPase